MIIDLTNQPHKIFCWVQDPAVAGIPSHGLALGDDGVMLGICKEHLPSTIMPALAHQSALFDSHFGKHQWELVFVSKYDVENLGSNVDFDNAIDKNNQLAAEVEST